MPTYKEDKPLYLYPLPETYWRLKHIEFEYRDYDHVNIVRPNRLGQSAMYKSYLSEHRTQNWFDNFYQSH